MTAASELEQEQRTRFQELTFLQNICNGLPEADGDRMRRSMVLILYAHFEGFTKFALELYVREVQNSSLKCCEVQPVLATTALGDVFKKLRNPEAGKDWIPAGLRSYKDLKTIAVEAHFVEHARTFDNLPVSIPDGYVDLESNLKPAVLRKNLFRLGLPIDMLDSTENLIHQLLNRRNQIAHGATVTGIDSKEYQGLRDVVENLAAAIKLKVIEAIDNRAYALVG